MRGSRQGDSHGGLYLVDMEAGAFDQVYDWNSSDISFEGRGADRGLRGIAIVGDDIFIAASDELFVFDRQFRITASYRNPYLKHCHEIWPHAGRLWLTSTGFDSILRLDVATRQFDFGVRFHTASGALNAQTFDPRGQGGPAASNDFHINSVHADDTGIYVSGRRLPALARLLSSGISIVAPLPLGTHNARPFNGGVLFNDTDSDSLKWLGQNGSSKSKQLSIPVPRYPEANLTHTGFDDIRPRTASLRPRPLRPLQHACRQRLLAHHSRHPRPRRGQDRKIPQPHTGHPQRCPRHRPLAVLIGARVPGALHRRRLVGQRRHRRSRRRS